jgi:hypothetical protein
LRFIENAIGYTVPLWKNSTDGIAAAVLNGKN